jgi:predicted HTH domain antitoxin
MRLELDIPADLMLTEFDLKMRFASHLFAEGLVTSGQGAKIVGISRRTFIEILGKYGVSAFQSDEDELLEDIANA